MEPQVVKCVTLRALGATLAKTVACGTKPADAFRALVGAAPEPSIGGSPPTWLCDHQFYTPPVAYAYKPPLFMKHAAATSGHQFPLVRFPASHAPLEFNLKTAVGGKFFRIVLSQ